MIVRARPHPGEICVWGGGGTYKLILTAVISFSAEGSHWEKQKECRAGQYNNFFVCVWEIILALAY